MSGGAITPILLSRLVGLIYESVADPRAWEDFVAALHASGSGGQVSFFMHGHGPGPTVVAQAGWDEGDLAAYRAYYARISPYVQHAHLGPLRQPVVGKRVLHEIGYDLERSAYYNEFVLERRLGTVGSALVLERRGNAFAALSHVHDDANPARLDRQLSLQALLMPHLVRAIELQRLLADARDGRAALTGVLDRLALPILTFDAQGCLELANDSAQALLQRRDGLGLDLRGRPVGADTETTARLNRAIAGAVRRGAASAPPPEGARVPLPRQPPSPPLVALVAPLPEGGAGTKLGATGRCRALMVVGGAERTDQEAIDAFARRHGLTPAEARLAGALSHGLSVQAAADRLGITVGTARVRLKTVFQKAGCSRQAELVRLILREAPLQLVGG